MSVSGMQRLWSCNIVKRWLIGIVRANVKWNCAPINILKGMKQRLQRDIIHYSVLYWGLLLMYTQDLLCGELVCVY